MWTTGRYIFWNMDLPIVPSLNRALENVLALRRWDDLRTIPYVQQPFQIVSILYKNKLILALIWWIHHVYLNDKVIAHVIVLFSFERWRSAFLFWLCYRAVCTEIKTTFAPITKLNAKTFFTAARQGHKLISSLKSQPISLYAKTRFS